MRRDLPSPGDTTVARRIGASVTVYDTGSPRDLIVGTEGLEMRDLSPYVASLGQNESGANIRLEFPPGGLVRPAVGRLIQISVGSAIVFNGVIDSIASDNESRGSREITLSIRQRDATPWWREVRRVGPPAAVGMDLGSLARDIGRQLGLTSEEMLIPETGIVLAHGEAHLADMNSWDMLEMTLLPGLLEPIVDGRGVLKTLSRSLRRTPDLTLSRAQVAEIGSSNARPPITHMRVKWLDPLLMKVSQQEQVLGNTTLTSGFFQPTSDDELWWSEDQTMRAEDTWMRIIQSVNGGLLQYGEGVLTFGASDASEKYVQTSEFGGSVSVGRDVGAYAADLAVMAAFVAGGCTLGSIPVVGGMFQSAALAVALSFLLKVGAGSYEIRGVPFDFVHVINESEAYDSAAEPWQTKVEEIENDMIPNWDVANMLATNEILYRAREASRGQLTIADDFRIERGDLLEIWDGRQFYVQGYSRDLTRGAEALLRLEGFWL